MRRRTLSREASSSSTDTLSALLEAARSSSTAVEVAAFGRSRAARALARLGDERVLRRELARRVGRGCIARQRERLAAAASEVHRASVAALAWLGHPRLAAISEK